MKPIYEAWYCQIEVTNVCNRNCAYCSRYDRHLRPDQRFFMSLDTFRKALESLNGWKNGIGIIGGEPTLHPQFQEICTILKDEFKLPKRKLGLWTSGSPKLDEYMGLIKQTFKMLAYNPHSELQQQTCLHQPLTLAIEDVIDDREYAKKLIDDCWCSKAWCPSISPKGCFFCEVACALDTILDSKGGWPIEPRWWDKKPEQFQDQVERYCWHCGMAIPMEREPLGVQKEKISLGLYNLFKEHHLNRLGEKHVVVVDKKLTKEEVESKRPCWFPYDYRQDLPPNAPRWIDL